MVWIFEAHTIDNIKIPLYKKYKDDLYIFLKSEIKDHQDKQAQEK